MIDKIKKALILSKGIYGYNVLRFFKTLPPTELQINVTYRCNSRCRMCGIWKMKPENELSFEQWRKIMGDSVFSTIQRLVVTGGEPLLHPRLVELTKLFLGSMPKLQFLNLTTNGFLTKKAVETVKKLSRLAAGRGIHFSVSVSLDGIGQTHDLIRGIDGVFEKTKKTVLALKSIRSKYNFRLGVGGVISRENLDKIERVEEWCNKREIDFNYQIIGFHETYVQNMDQKNLLGFRKEDKKTLYSLLRKLATPSSRFGFRSWIKSYYWKDMLSIYQGGNRTTPCPFLYDAFVLDSLGDVYYCLSERKIGNCLKGKTVSQIYYHPKNLAFRKKMTRTVCLKCNSGCFVSSAIIKDFKRFAWFGLTGKCRRRRPPVLDPNRRL